MLPPAEGCPAWPELTSTRIFGVDAGIWLYVGVPCWAQGAVPSLDPQMIIVGTVTPVPTGE